jgi:hypothetical protein
VLWLIIGLSSASTSLGPNVVSIQFERVLALAPQQSRSGTAVLAIIPPVTAVILAVIAAVAPVIAAVVAPVMTPHGAK